MFILKFHFSLKKPQKKQAHTNKLIQISSCKRFLLHMHEIEVTHQGPSHPQDVVELLSVSQREAAPHTATAKELGTGFHCRSFSSGVRSSHDPLRCPHQAQTQAYQREQCLSCSCAFLWLLGQGFTTLKSLLIKWDADSGEHLFNQQWEMNASRSF